MLEKDKLLLRYKQKRHAASGAEPSKDDPVHRLSAEVLRLKAERDQFGESGPEASAKRLQKKYAKVSSYAKNLERENSSLRSKLQVSSSIPPMICGGAVGHLHRVWGRGGWQTGIMGLVAGL